MPERIFGAWIVNRLICSCQTKVQQRDQFDGCLMNIELQNPDCVALTRALGADAERAATPEAPGADLSVLCRRRGPR